MYLPSEDIFAVITISEWPLNVLIILPVFISQSFIKLSNAPVKAYLPSGVKITDETAESTLNDFIYFNKNYKNKITLSGLINNSQKSYKYFYGRNYILIICTIINL